jgi:tetratricopeptide (TPR) repeat protein
VCWLAFSCAPVLGAFRAGAEPVAKAPERLPELPTIPSLELARPTPADLEELDARLAKLCSEDEAEREAARREALEVDAKLVSAIRFRLASTAESTNHDDLKQLLLKIRKKGRDDARDEDATDGKHGKVKTPDYLQMAGEHAEPHSKLWCNLSSVLAGSRMLAQIGTVEAVRGLIDVYVRYGEFLRVDTQLQIEGLGDRAVPALVEAKRHPAEKIAKWANRELDALGKGIPSEAVQTNDLQVLSDVLRAYGRVRDPDAARIVVSFANSERAQVREASRQAIAMLGEVGAWQLRDTFETVVGKKPPRDWNWERTARELFAEFDRLRSAEVSQLFDAGVAAREKGDLEAMRKAFDQVLTRSPDYPKRDELAAAYLEYAQKTAQKNPASALSALRRAERLGKGSELEKTASSMRLTLEAEALAATGIADRTLLTRALEVNPQNRQAQSELSRFDHGEVKTDDTFRYLGAGAIGLVALAGIAFVLFRRQTPEPFLANGNATAPSDNANVASTTAAPNESLATESPAKPSTTATADDTSPAASTSPTQSEPTKVEEPTPPDGEVSSETTEPTE